MSLTLFDFDEVTTPVLPEPEPEDPKFLDGCSRKQGHLCGECRLGLGRHCHLDTRCSGYGKYTFCTICMQAGTVRVMRVDDREAGRRHLFEDHGMAFYGPRSGTCADPQPYARLAVDRPSGPVQSRNIDSKEGTIVADTNTAEAVVEKPKKDVSQILPNVPAEYKNPNTGRYKPGHDAKHASDVAKAIVGGADEAKALAALGSDTLRAKALKQVENHNERLAKQGIEGEVTVKGEVYDARKVRGSGAVRYDGPKGWVEVDAENRIAKTFKSRAELDKEALAADEAESAEAVDAE